MALYRASFPLHEQRESPSQEQILQDEAYFFYLIYDGEQFVGLLLCWETGQFIYVEHLCIRPELRCRHYGQRALEYLQQKGKTIILEIDPPVDDLSRRRMGFYERNHFNENAYAHIHPPYHRENVGHPLVILSYPNRLTAGDYQQFFTYLKEHIMKDVFL